jgi:hypothetical protein
VVQCAKKMCAKTFLKMTSPSDMALQFECRKIALKQDRTGFVLTLTIHPDELPEELIRDFVGARYACVMVRLKDDESATEYSNRTQQAGILCRNPMFQSFMGQAYAGREIVEEETAEALCIECGIDSRTELNGNVSAKHRFDEILQEFEIWKTSL